MEPDRILSSLDLLYNEVCNGGFLQYFLNCNGTELFAVESHLRHAGADAAAEIYLEALSVLPNDLPENALQRRCTLLESLSDVMRDRLHACDLRFYEQVEALEEVLDRIADESIGPSTWDHLACDGGEKDYPVLFEKLSQDVCATWEELADPKLRRKHNKAQTQIHKLKMALLAMPDKGGPIIQKLLCSKNPQVRIAAGAYCISAGLFEARGRFVLCQIASDPSVPKMLRHNAKECLEYCRPYKKG